MAKVAKIDEDFVATSEPYESQEDDIVRRKEAGKPPPNHVLLFTIINPFYPINVSVIHSICKRFGKISRIVIFRKNGVQAMVEVDNVETAEKMKSDLDEKEIYTGCCKLKVDFAKPSRLNVVRNNSQTWDYTKDPEDPTSPNDTNEVVQYKTGSGLLDFPTEESQDNAEYYGEGAEREENICDVSNIAIAYPTVNMYNHVSLVKAYDDYSEYGCVVMAYNLNDKVMNPDGVFNLFCMYGNVWKVKFLKSKKGCAMIQMGDRQGAERCLMYLEGVPLFGDTLQLGISKQAFLGDMGRGFELANGTYSLKDFTNSKNNRFLTPTMANKNRLNHPSKVLHFFNMPPNLTAERLETFITATAGVSLVDVTVFPNKSDKSSSGLMEFESVADAVTCVVLCNNVPMQGTDNGPPFFIKLCFSSVTSVAIAEQQYEKKYMKYEKTDWL